MSVLFVTGTGTGVGKTVVTAAVAALAQARAASGVAVVKPRRPARADGDSDVAEVRRLAGLPADRSHELADYPEPLAPADGRAPGGLAAAATSRTPPRRCAPGRRATTASSSRAPAACWSASTTTGVDARRPRRRRWTPPCSSWPGRPRHPQPHRADPGGARRTAAWSRSGVVIGSWPAEPDLADRAQPRPT